MRINKVFSLQHDSVMKHTTNRQCCLTDYCLATPLLDMLEYYFYTPLPPQKFEITKRTIAINVRPHLRC